MNKMTIAIAVLCTFLAKARCPDVLYNCFAGYEPNFFTYEEIDLYNNLLDGKLAKKEYNLFPFVNVPAHYDETNKRCVKSDDADRHARAFCALKYPYKGVTTKELKKESDASVYTCLENGLKTGVEILAYDQGIAQLKCQIIAASITHNPDHWRATKKYFGILEKVASFTSKCIREGLCGFGGENALKNSAHAFIDAWLHAKDMHSVQAFIPHWLKAAITAPERPAVDPTLATLARAITMYQEKKAKKHDLLELGDLLSTPSIFSPSHSREEHRKACRRLRLLYHPDKHPGSDSDWWTERFKEIGNACSKIE